MRRTSILLVRLHRVVVKLGLGVGILLCWIRCLKVALCLIFKVHVETRLGLLVSVDNSASC